MQTRSHLTQQLQNYFDVQDVRVRQLPYSLDAQLLNAAAQPIELHQLRYQRELDARFVSSCPLGLDNRGVYYQVQLPNSLPLSLDANGNALPPAQVVGIQHGQPVVLTAFDDTLPVPASVSLDTSRASVPLPSLLLGTIDSLFVGQIQPGVLPVPNRLSFWTSGEGDRVALDVVIRGKTWPRTFWPGSDNTVTESFLITTEGLSRSQNIFYSVESIQIFGLTQGSVDICALEIALPYVADLSRPFTEWDNREISYDRYWQVRGNVLEEVYYKNSELGFPDPPLISSLVSSQMLNDMAVEPSTFGALAVGGSTLYYFDRREPLPAALGASALSAEPCYGVYAHLDDDTSSIRQVLLDLQPYTGAGSETGYRWTVVLPDGSLWIYAFHASYGWTLQPWDALFWSKGSPASGVPFSLTLPGTYVFKLETRDSEGNVLYDSCPFLNRTFTPLAQFELDLPAALGIAFDAQYQLWIWDGFFLHPYRLAYEGYVWDAGTRTLYLTRPFDAVQVTP